MNILSIETSCDETAISIVRAEGDFPHATYAILGNSLWSQIDIHREYGGVFPTLAKREHARTLVPMLEKALQEAAMSKEEPQVLNDADFTQLEEILAREAGLADALRAFSETHAIPPIDYIAVTSGPGLEPALWVGLSFAKALAHLWNVPVIPVNHMEGHVLASVFNGTALPKDISFPALALLISGGHTEMLEIADWRTYTLVGKTRDDAVGEAFDKVARMLGLPYPGGPEISACASRARTQNLPMYAELPRPMLDSDTNDFSFSGLKTAMRYIVENIQKETGELAPETVDALARDFEDAVTEVLLKKIEHALEETNAQTLILGGGVTANTHIRTAFTERFDDLSGITLFLPEQSLSTDNAVMIALAGHAHIADARTPLEARELVANGNQSLS